MPFKYLVVPASDSPSHGKSLLQLLFTSFSIACQAPQGSRNLKHDATGFLAATKSWIHTQLMSSSKCHQQVPSLLDTHVVFNFLLAFAAPHVHGMVANLPGGASAQLNRLHPRAGIVISLILGQRLLARNTRARSLIVKQLRPCSS